MSDEPEWERQSRIKEDAWKWAARRLELEVVTDELEGDLSQDEKEMLEHVRKVICKTLERQGLRMSRNRRRRSGATLAEVFAAEEKVRG